MHAIAPWPLDPSDWVRLPPPLPGDRLPLAGLATIALVSQFIRKNGIIWGFSIRGFSIYKENGDDLVFFYSWFLIL